MKVDAKPSTGRYQAREVGKHLTEDRQLAVIRYSPCGKYLLGGDFEGSIRRWDATGAALAALPQLTGHHGWVQAVAFHTDGKRLFSADSWGRLSCWSFTEKAGKPLWSVVAAHQGWIRKLAVSPDGKTLASCGADGKVRLWTPDKGERTQEWAHGLDVLSLIFAPDGKTLLFGDLKGSIHRRETLSGLRRGGDDPGGRRDRADIGGLRAGGCPAGLLRRGERQGEAVARVRHYE
jgi:WD40 repeat protein